MPVDLPNLRDVAGLVTDDGRRVRAGILLRSALPAADDVVPDDLAWPPTVVIDLRSPHELVDGHPLDHLEARLVNLPLLEELRPREHHDSPTLTMLYQVVLEDAAALLVNVVHEIADADGPVLVHCAAGKDRTGVSVALVLRLLGVTHNDVLADYILSEQAHTAIDTRLNRNYAAPAVPVAFYGVAPEALDAVLKIWDDHPEGVEGWFVDAGGDVASLERLRERMLD